MQLRKCALNGNLQGIINLLDFGTQNPYDIADAIEVALICRHIKIAEYLHSRGFRARENIIVVAATNGDFRMMKILVANNYDLHIDDNFALGRAVANESSKMVKYMLKHGCHPNAPSNHAFIVINEYEMHEYGLLLASHNYYRNRRYRILYYLFLMLRLLK